MDLIRWSTLAYTMSHDVVMLYAVVTLLHATHSRSTHGVRIPTLRRVMDASSHRSHGSPHHRIMDHGDVVDHVLSLDVPWMVLPSPWLLVFVCTPLHRREYHHVCLLCTAVAMAIQRMRVVYIMAPTGRDPGVPWMLVST